EIMARRANRQLASSSLTGHSEENGVIDAFRVWFRGAVCRRHRQERIRPCRHVYLPPKLRLPVLAQGPAGQLLAYQPAIPSLLIANAAFVFFGTASNSLGDGEAGILPIVAHIANQVDGLSVGRIEGRRPPR